MARLVIGDAFFLGHTHHAILFLQAQHYSINGFFDIEHLDLIALATRRKECRFIDDVGEIRSGHSRRSSSDLPKIRTWTECDLARMDFEDGFTAIDVRPVDNNLPIEPSSPQERLVENFRDIRCCHDDDFFRSPAGRPKERLLESVHLVWCISEGS